jgi:polysaccharide biosynthesis protein VpsI
MKNVLYIAPSIFVKGGISTVIKSYLNSDLAKNHHISLVSSHVDGPKWCKLIRAILGLVQTVYYLTFKKIDFAHVHGSDIVSSSRKSIYIQILRLFGRKIIYHFHGASFMEYYRSASQRTQSRMRALFEKVDIVICLSESWRQYITDIAPRANIKVVPNATHLPELCVKQNLDDLVHLTFLGLIGERKGLFDLLRVVRRLIDNDLKIKLSIGGNGENDRLQATIKSLKLNDSVNFLGWISEKQRDKLLRETDVFVLPSYGEGMPMSILEAMSYSVPVVSTTVGGIPELVLDGETGFLIEPGDLDALYEKLKCLIQDKELRKKFGRKGRLVIENRFNIDLVSQKIKQIYNFI